MDCLLGFKWAWAKLGKESEAPSIPSRLLQEPTPVALGPLFKIEHCLQELPFSSLTILVRFINLAEGQNNVGLNRIERLVSFRLVPWAKLSTIISMVVLCCQGPTLLFPSGVVPLSTGLKIKKERLSLPFKAQHILPSS